ncbi:MAG TPA: STAS domain-containing protein [Catenuloplanes sp.]|jgi:anti-sigma B factor antagonist
MQAVSVSADTDGTLDVALCGEIDYANSAQVLETIRDGVRRVAPTVIRVEMAQVTFLDSSGISVLVHTMRLADEQGAAFRLEHPNANVYDQLSMSGLLTAFGLAEPSPES